MSLAKKIMSSLLLVVFAATLVASPPQNGKCPAKKMMKKNCCVAASTVNVRACVSIKRSTGCCCKILPGSQAQAPSTTGLATKVQTNHDQAAQKIENGRQKFASVESQQKVTLYLHSNLKFLSDTKLYIAFESYLI